MNSGLSIRDFKIGQPLYYWVSIDSNNVDIVDCKCIKIGKKKICVYIETWNIKKWLYPHQLNTPSK